MLAVHSCNSWLYFSLISEKTDESASESNTEESDVEMARKEAGNDKKKGKGEKKERQDSEDKKQKGYYSGKS